MTADDLRKHSEKTFWAVKNGFLKDSSPNSALVSVQLQIMQAAWEIAAQLAELNEYLQVERTRTSQQVAAQEVHDKSA